MELLRAAGLVVSVSVAGCIYRTPTVRFPPEAPFSASGALHIEPVAVVNNTEAPAGMTPTQEAQAQAQLAAEVNSDVQRLLTRAVRLRDPSQEATRIRVRVVLGRRSDAYARGMHQDGYAVVVLGLPVVLGWAYEHQRLSVDITLETQGGTFVGHGAAEEAGGIYAPARRRALAVALERALATARISEPASVR